MKKALYKVPNGKLLKIFLETMGEKISYLRISGDFFAHPEENIERLETSLVNEKLDANSLTAKIELFLKENPTILFGVDTPSIVSTILNAI